MKTLIVIIFLSVISHSLYAEEDIWGNEAGFVKDDSQATILRHMARQRALQANMTAEQRAQMRKNQQAGCGAVNIGNVTDTKGDAEAVVIIKGDVINANNNCK